MSSHASKEKRQRRPPLPALGRQKQLANDFAFSRNAPLISTSMRALLPLVFVGVVAGSSLVGAAGTLPPLHGGALGELAATHR
jgi:hypothetical protein